MGEAFFDGNHPLLKRNLSAAVVLCKTEQGTLHSGILYRQNQSEEVLHLAWEDRLKQDWQWEKLIAVPEVEPEKLFSIGGLCRLILKNFLNKKKIPYGIGFNGTTFDNSGNLVLGPESRGLTCATFVLAVFKYFEINLVDESTWPVRLEDDKKFLEFIKGFAQPNHFQLLKIEIESGVKRIRPDEILAACSFPPPASFQSVITVVPGIQSLVSRGQKIGCGP